MINVLLIDDDSHDAYITRQHLKRIPDQNEYVVNEVSSMNAALEALRAPFDVCLLDLNLGTMNAFELIGQLAPEEVHGPIILLTGDDSDDHLDSAQNPLIADYINKVVANSEILARSIRYAIRDFRAMSRLHFLAKHDSLTGLYMRSHFNDQIAIHLSRAAAGGSPFAVFYMDLDGFKAINDQHGHDVGDEVLKQVATRLKSKFRTTDVVARYGGDEFVALAAVPDKSAASQVGRKVLNAFRSPIVIGANQFQCTASVGIALAHDDSTPGHELMRRADHAMYLAKRAGKDTLRVFSAEQDSLSPNSLSRGDALRQAISQQTLEIGYQPFFAVQQGCITGAEALLRWNDPTHGPLPVDQVLLLAEELSLTRELDRAVLTSVAKDITQLHEQSTLSTSFIVSVNIEPAALTASDFAPFIRRLLDEYPALTGRLMLEVVERALLPDHKEILSTLNQIKAFGVPIYIDDFGTGHSALSYLAKLPVSGFKLDKEFIADLGKNPRARLLLEGIISLAKELELGVIVEGIETEKQLAIIKTTDAPVGQGYYFSADLAPTELATFIQEHA